MSKEMCQKFVDDANRVVRSGRVDDKDNNRNALSRLGELMGKYPESEFKDSLSARLSDCENYKGIVLVSSMRDLADAMGSSWPKTEVPSIEN